MKQRENWQSVHFGSREPDVALIANRSFHIVAMLDSRPGGEVPILRADRDSDRIVIQAGPGFAPVELKLAMKNI